MIKGCHCTEEQKKKSSESHKGQIAWNKGLTKETDERLMEYSKTKTGYHHTKKTKEKMSESQKVRFSFKEARDKMGRLKMGNTNFLGRKHTEETKRKISESHKGMITSKKNETKIKRS